MPVVEQRSQDSEGESLTTAPRSRYVYAKHDQNSRIAAEAIKQTVYIFFLNSTQSM